MQIIDDQIRGTMAGLAETILGSIYNRPDANRNAVLGQIIIELGTKIESNNFTLEDFAETRKKLAAFNRVALVQLNR